MGICTCCTCSIILVALVFGIGITGFVSVIIVGVQRFGHIKPMNYQVSNASLVQFNLTSNNTALEYNLALNITIENPNKKIGFHFDQTEASASYKGQTLNNVTINSFYLGHKKTVVLPALFKGRQPVALSADVVSNFKDTANFDFVLNLDVTWSIEFLLSKQKLNLPYICNLKVPLNSNGTSAESFKITRCSKA